MEYFFRKKYKINVDFCEYINLNTTLEDDDIESYRSIRLFFTFSQNRD